MRSCKLFLLLLAFPFCRAYGQETFFDVPSADILDKGKVYGELDGTVRLTDTFATFTPRVVVGIGHGIEIGVNSRGSANRCWVNSTSLRR
ncbi:MAG: hypothetical protein WCA38_03925 [Candidatus Acidiferrales bacterium]